VTKIDQTLSIPGANSATFVISSVQESDEGSYRCVVTGDCSAAISNAASLEVRATVFPDLDEDGDVDVVDFAIFSACFNGDGNPPAGIFCDAPDFDDDGDVDVVDFAEFVSCFNGSDQPPACN